MYQAIILGCILLVTLDILKRLRDPKLNMPPLVPYKIPIIGHTISFMFNSEEFFRQCREKYGDIFSIYIWGQVKTFVGKEHSHEILTKDDTFDFGEGFRRRFPADIMFKYLKAGNPLKEIKEYILNKLGFYTERMQTSLYSATQKHIGDCDEPKTIYSIHNVITKVISTPIANIFVGEEAAKHDEIITTFAQITRDIAKIIMIPPILNFIYPGLQNYVNSIPLRLGLCDPSAKHRHVLTKHIKNQVEKRLKEKQTYGDLWKRPDDLLQDLIDEESFDIATIVDKMCFFIFVSVHSTSMACANAMMDLASRPEYMQELYEEQLEIHKQADENGILPLEALNEMKKLDSFIRESLRLTGHISVLPHVVVKDHTFSNGLQVPKGHTVEIYSDDIVRDESLQGPNPKSFEPFRHLGRNISATKIGKSYIVFGNGKHACPGRHFAINEVKFFMHNAIVRYNFRTETGKVEEKRRIGTFSLPGTNGIIFEKRI